MASATYVVLPNGCRPGAPLDCQDSRGGLFNINRSTTWSERGFFELGLKKDLDYAGNGHFGFDELGFGFDDTALPSLPSQLVAGLITEQHHLGLLGLSPHPINFTDFADPQPSLLTTLKARGIIPSLSWGYTAGARYRLKMVAGSLTLGGFDASRFIPNNVSFSFADDIGRELVVGLQSIISTDASGRSSTLLDSGVLTFVDSTVPHLWLPLEVCQAFENVFGLIWNEAESLYLVNDSLHDALLLQNPNFTFRLGNSIAGGETIDIVLPYASFDLNVSFPLVQNSTRYFPLKRAADDTQYTLGRTFLQEAYLTTDYERARFSISQCQFQDQFDDSIVVIEGTGQPNATATTSRKTSPIGRRAIGGIVAGAAVVLLVIGVITFFLLARKGIFSRDRAPTTPSFYDDNPFNGPQELDPAVIKERVELPTDEKQTVELEVSKWDCELSCEWGVKIQEVPSQVASQEVHADPVRRLDSSNIS
ncbi:MAG: hypothetical protein M1817_004495 [Caeruleum heppii]|nr:MAG: hypothetical protein M1817_004495 [Caeruleum heppii]